MALSNIDYNEFDKYEDLNIKKPPQQKNTENFQELEAQGIRIPRLYDLLYVYPIAVLLYVTRLLFER